MKTIALENLRSLKETPSMRVAPITVLVGNNSSGKSTFLRTFPLFKQSSEVRTIGSLLWCGKYVDFGSFSEALNRDAEDGDAINCKLDVEIPLSRMRRPLFASNTRTSISSPRPIPVGISVNIRQEGKHADITTSTFTIAALGHKIRLEVNSDFDLVSYEVNGTDFTKPASVTFQPARSIGLIPRLRVKVYREGDAPSGGLEEIAIEKIKNIVHGRTSRSRILDIVHVMRMAPSSVMLKTLKSRHLLGEYGYGVVERWTESTPSFRQLRDIIVALSFSQILDPIAEYVTDLFYKSKYIRPVRAAIDRYNRLQNFADDELTAGGENLPMFLSGLSKARLESLKNWVKERFGFELSLEKTKGHVSVLVRSGIEPFANIADSGFGYTQILPIIVQLWDSATSSKSTYYSFLPTIFAVEQPELHLHPKLQARLGDVIARTVRECMAEDADIRIIVETHSEALIKAIGRAICNKIITPEDVAIYIFNKEDISSTAVLESTFDEDGFLTNWPYGFFDGE